MSKSSLIRMAFVLVLLSWSAGFAIAAGLHELHVRDIIGCI